MSALLFIRTELLRAVPRSRHELRRLLPTRLPYVQRALGYVGALGLGLVYAQKHLGPLADRIVEKTFPTAIAKEVIWGGTGGSTVGATQWWSYLLAMAFPIAAVAAFGTLEFLLSLHRIGRVVAQGVRLSMVVAAYLAARKLSPFVGDLALVVIPAMVFLIAPYTSGEAVPEPETSTRTMATYTLTIEAASLGWGLWLVGWKSDGLWVLASITLLVAFAAFRAGRLSEASAGVDGERALVRDAITGAPLLLVPALGLVREPGVRGLALALVVGALLRAAAIVTNTRKLPSILPALAPWAIGAMFVIPLDFRELPEASLFKHEGQHLAWINAVLAKKWLMADIGFLYGPFREYMLAGWARVFGVTLEQVRLGHLFQNLLGMAMMLVAAWYVVGRRPVVHALFAYLLVTKSPLHAWLDYRNAISFGWADVGRIGWAASGLVGALWSLEQIPLGSMPKRRDVIRLVGFGALTGLAALYSQEFGLCACGSVGLSIVADRLLRRDRSLSLPKRAVHAVVLGALFAAGFIAVLAGFIGIYALFGKARVLVRTYVEIMSLTAKGVYGASPSPVHVDSILSPSTFLVQATMTGNVAEWFAAPAVQLVAAIAVIATVVRRAWTPRSTLLLSLLLFGVTAFRMSLLRSDTYHLSAGSAPTMLLLAALLGNAWGFARAPARGRVVRLGVLVAFALLVVRAVEGMPRALTARIELVAKGTEHPSTSPGHRNEGLSRAGDMYIPPDTEAIAKYVLDHTEPSDTIFFRMPHTMEGGEILFLTGRQNATHFCMQAELVTHADQRDTLASLQTTPPKLIFGNDPTVLGPEVTDYIGQHWKSVGSVAGVPVFELDPSTL